MCKSVNEGVNQLSQSAAPLPSRRTMLGRAIAASAICMAAGSEVSAEEAIPTTNSDSHLTPDQALKQLYEGNLRFTKGKSLSQHRDLSRVREIAAQQKPFAAFLGCADSRVPIEFVFDQGFGDLFVTRIAGNIASSENIGSLEFGTQVLGARVIFVLGHTNCGAVSATMQGTEVPGQISGLFQYIRPAVKAANGDLNKAIIANVRNQAVLIAEASPVVSKMLQAKELIVAGGVYDLATGIVTEVDISV